MVVWPVVMAAGPLAVLAQQSVAQRNMRAVLLWGGLLLVVGLAVGVGIMALRRRVLPKEENPPDQVWSLQDLRRMRESGELSEEEFETLRARLIARMGGAERSKPARGERGTGDPGPA